MSTLSRPNLPKPETVAEISAHLGSVGRYLSPVTLARDLWTHRDLIRQFARREVEGRYRGSLLGFGWSLINPITLLLVYTFVFGVILKARWHGQGNLKDFAIVLFCGLVVLNVFSECMNRAATLIVSVPNYVKKVIFPIQVLPVAVLLSALFHALLNISVLLALNTVRGHWPPVTLLLLPLTVVPLVFLTLGLTWILASLGVFMRDIGNVVTLAVQVLTFVTPVFYPLEAVPEPFRTVVRLNPLTAIVEDIRAVALWGTLPDPRTLAISCVASGALMMVGYAFFMKTKKGFADVL